MNQIEKKSVNFIIKQLVMNTSEIKARIHEMIDNLDEPFLEIVHSMLDTYVKQKYNLSQDQKDLLDKRLDLHAKNKDEGKEWDSLRTELLS